MTPSRFEEFVKQTFADLQEIMVAKNTEYARSAEDRLMNFKRRAETLGLDPITVLQVDLFKHIDAINSYIIRFRTKAPVKLNDPINLRINDSIVYLMLMKALIEDLGLQDQLTTVGVKEHQGGQAGSGRTREGSIEFSCIECSQTHSQCLTFGCKYAKKVFGETVYPVKCFFSPSNRNTA